MLFSESSGIRCITSEPNDDCFVEEKENKMNNKFVGASGLVLVLLGLITIVCVFALQDGIQNLDWIDAEAAALGSMVICVVGCILGWVSFRTSTGKVAAVLGTLLLAFYVVQLLRRSEPAPSAPLPEVASLKPLLQAQYMTEPIPDTGPAVFDPKVRCKKTIDGITAQVEKVWVERILNEPARMDRSGPHWRQRDFSHSAESWRSFRFVHIFISFHGAVETIKSIEQTTVEFATDHTGRSMGIARFDPPMVARRLRDIAVDPDARAIEYWVHLGKNDSLWKLFPLRIEQIVKLTNGETLTFVFENVAL